MRAVVCLFDKKGEFVEEKERDILEADGVKYVKIGKKSFGVHQRWVEDEIGERQLVWAYDLGREL